MSKNRGVVYLEPGKVESDRIGTVNSEQFSKLRDDGLPAILFTGHISNFELLPMVAVFSLISSTVLLRVTF